VHDTSAPEKVAFVAHPVDGDIFKSYISSLRPDKAYDDRLLLKLFEWAKTYQVKEFPSLSLDASRHVDAELFMVPFLPEMQSISVRKVIEKIDGALDLARKRGCTVAAMGGFTSIVLQNLEDNFSRKHNIRITSGNTLTAALIIRSIEEIACRFGLDLASVTMAVIGASGDIGSACSEYFSSRVYKLICTARSIPTLSMSVERFGTKATAEIELTDDNRDAVQRSSICIFVTSAHVALFSEDDFRPGTVVCDASAPQNIVIRNELRDDVFIYHGGIASIPFSVDVDFDIGLADSGMFYGCQLEGLLCALHPELPCSWGRGNITMDKLDLFFGVLDRYPALRPVYSMGNKRFTDELLNNYARHWPSLTNPQQGGTEHD
jgi:predicted amino acid dehydrogenase